MSAAAHASRRERLVPGEASAATTVLIVAIAMLASRTSVSVTEDERVALLVTCYLTIGLASVVIPVHPAGARLSPPLALLLGVGAIAAARVATGPAVAVPWGAAALPLSLLAAVAEEALFRRLAYARLERFGTMSAIAGSALLFGLVHVPAYGVAALPVDLGAGLLFGWQRWSSGTWTVPATTHAAANVLAVLR